MTKSPEISRRPLRIVQVAPDFYPVPPDRYGGIERVMHALVENMVQSGHDVFLYAREGSKTSAHLIPYQHEGSNPNEIANFVIRSLPEDVDVIHDHTHLSVVGRRSPGIPTVCTSHDRLNNGVDYPVYLSRRALEVVGNGHGFYAYNGIDVAEYEFCTAKDDYLLFLGVLNWHKGLHLALDVAEATHQRLLIAGPVFNQEYYRKYVAPRIEANEKIQYIGEVGGQERQCLLKKAKCTLFPTSWEEPFGLVMIESMACGTPVLGLANGAVPEVLSGFPELVCDSVEEMIDKVNALEFPPPVALREYVERNFSTSVMTDKYLDIYHEVIQMVPCNNPCREADGENSIELLESDRDGTRPPYKELSAQEVLESANHLKHLHRYNEAVEVYERVLHSAENAVQLKLAACDGLADIYHQLGMKDKEREIAFKSFKFDTPRAEFCCRLGFDFLQNNKIELSIFWYKLATSLQHPVDRSELYYEACWTWLPHVQLCIGYYRLGDLERAWEHNEIARTFAPDNEYVLHNKQLLETLLDRKSLSLIGDETTDVTVKNGVGGSFRMQLTLPGYIEEMIVKRGAWEPELARILSSFVQRGSVFLDVGANIGFHSLYVASEHSDATCVAFEPHPVLCRQMDRNRRANGYEHVVTHELAVGDTTKSVDFHMQLPQSYNRGMSGIEYFHAIGRQYERARVQMVSLDDLLPPADKAKVSVMKIDTQGYEYHVLKGAWDIIHTSRPVIALEHHSYAGPGLEDILVLLEGYQVYKIQPWTGKVFRYPGPDPEDFLFDYICLPDWASADVLRL